MKTRQRRLQDLDDDLELIRVLMDAPHFHKHPAARSIKRLRAQVENDQLELEEREAAARQTMKLFQKTSPQLALELEGKEDTNAQ